MERKKQYFTIFLLKKGWKPSNALIIGNGMKKVDASEAVGLPRGAILYTQPKKPKTTWWAKYFGLTGYKQASHNALLFLPVGDRIFALTFGHSAHKLDQYSYHHDFGTIVTLNCVDPQKLRSIDSFDPVAARHTRSQLPFETGLTMFDFDNDKSILKSITGKVKKEYTEFSRATGTSCLRISIDKLPGELPGLCSKLLRLYGKKTYEKSFPEINKITAVRDPELIQKLDKKLFGSLKNRDENLYLSVPEIIDYSRIGMAKYRGVGKCKENYEVSLDSYYHYLDSHNVKLGSLSDDVLKRHHIRLLDDNGITEIKEFNLHSCLVCDYTMSGKSYYLNGGNWYNVDRNYISDINKALKTSFVDLGFPEFTDDNEGDYNSRVSDESGKKFFCLDKRNIAPKGETQVEPCDIIEFNRRTATFYHVKVGHYSHALSHLFSQGLNSLSLLLSDPRAQIKLVNLLSKRAGFSKDAIAKSITNGRCKVVFVIITRKDRNDQLPLFSRISLWRTIKLIKMLRIETEYGYVLNKK